ncbi:Outer membrane receptor proteins, mostly Fe transport [Hymenobacter daecheongensis DSM 21074]|uniref:Outer membrane receptor proteins, mostly Fe transport n=1 Tax=Hymenobacter daecheongensis DSM 21074 TaxID=1121955 RepID=A0A1M6HJH3_9BACT|nr:TonB-dependent receptor plug domain-containing protein [Hymenobacter daecheongensis]SHJ22321.1 Outer membrane receptor proteins, mostly Fe transport [Hymenobacter daecheongensis DSM 21074]
MPLRFLRILPLVAGRAGWLALFLLLFYLPTAQAQQAARILITGTVRDAGGQPLELVGVGIEGQPGGTNTDARGRFALSVTRPQSGKPPVLVARRLGFGALRVPLDLSSGAELNLTLTPDSRAIKGVTVRGRQDEADTREQVSITRIDPRAAKELPSAFGDFNKILTTLPGVVANNELTSTYAVRGGNYDENLVYVNGMEVYRPFLVTTSQQEGLSFVNPDLVDKIEFSSGGWQPKFGDKLSSVLSIDYKKPAKFGGSATASLVGGTMHVEATSPNKRVSYLAGIRYKNASYVLRSLRQQRGDYNPTFYDGQAYISAALGPKDDVERTSLSLLTSFAHNDYRLTPETGVATFSSATAQFKRLFIVYDGRERMQYDTYQGGLSLKHNFTPSLQGELLGSAMISRELEYRDVEASYSFAEVNTDPKAPDYNKAVRQRDVGSRFDHSRNTLLARVATLEGRGRWTPGQRHTVRWGLKGGRENIEDRLNEYSYVDSADFVPDYRRTRLVSALDLASSRTQGYAQHTIALDSLRTLTYGVRAHQWSVNGQLTVSPRVQYSFMTRRNPDLSFKLATGVYYQPPFYRELRDQTAGTRATPQSVLVQRAGLNPELRAQRSLHFIAGTELRFRQWERPFKLSSEVYYKYLTDVVPYDIDNVRLRYFAKNNATAYAAGFDARVSGEFVRGSESWFSLGLLTTRENIDGDSVTRYDDNGKALGREAQGYIRRPSDQRLNLGVFFQDQLPNNPTVKGYVNLVFGSGLPFSPPALPEERGTTKLTRSYKRVDLGFSKVLSLSNRPEATRRPGQLESLWIGVEVLNVLGANNVAGYSYVQDVNARTYAVPNYLSQRIVNLRVIARF